VSEEGAGARVPKEDKSGKPGTPQRGRIPRRSWENAATILMQFRDGHATDMETLFQVLDIYQMVGPVPDYLHYQEAASDYRVRAARSIGY
jgi:hypothetical protein